MKNITLVTSTAGFFRFNSKFISMKHLVIIIGFTGIFTLSANRARSQANTELSNLAATTKVNATLLPNFDNNIHLGSALKSWRDLYLDGSLYLDGTRFVSNWGINNVVVGNQAGFVNADQNPITAFSNTFVGAYSGYQNNTGHDNTFTGKTSGRENTSGYQNCFLGAQAGYGNTTGNSGTFVGFDAGGNNTTGSQNTYLGCSAEGSSSTFTNVVGIGYQLTNTASNQARIGNSSTTSIGGWAGWSNVSDGRFKKNVKEEVAGLSFINKLRPVTYTLDLHAADAFIGKEFTADYESEESAKISEQAKSEKEKIIYSGFIAQEVECAAKEIGYDFSGVDAPKNEKDLYGLRYAEFVVPLVKSVQELSAMNETKDEQIRELQNENATLNLRLQKIEQQLGLSNIDSRMSGNSRPASLEQNIPNPAKNSVIIRFWIPQNTSNAFLIIADANGKVIQRFDHLEGGASEVEIPATHLSPGVYPYTLFINGKPIDTKQMVIAE